MLAKLKALWSKLLSLLKAKTPMPTQGASAVTSPSIASPTAAADLREVAAAIAYLRQFPDPITPFALMKRLGRGMSEDEEDYAESQGVIYGEDPKPQGPRESSGTDLSDGLEKLYRLADGEPKTVTFNRPGTVRVVNYAGTQLLSVTDHLGERILSGTTSPYDRYMPAGSYTFSIKSIGGQVMVHLL